MNQVKGVFYRVEEKCELCQKSTLCHCVRTQLTCIRSSCVQSLNKFCRQTTFRVVGLIHGRHTHTHTAVWTNCWIIWFKSATHTRVCALCGNRNALILFVVFNQSQIKGRKLDAHNPLQSRLNTHSSENDGSCLLNSALVCTSFWRRFLPKVTTHRVSRIDQSQWKTKCWVKYVGPCLGC